jgi:predicted transcriptional regulator
MSPKSTNSNLIKNLNIVLIERILKNLSKHGPLKITTLAMHSQMNYSRCKQYLNLMWALNWIIFEKNGKTVLIKNTVSGNLIMERLSLFIDENNSPLNPRFSN